MNKNNALNRAISYENGKYDLFGVKVDTFFSLEDFIEHFRKNLFNKNKCKILSFVNPYSFYLSFNDDGSYRELLNKCDYILPDGIGVVVALGFLTRARVARLSFDTSSLYRPIFEILNQEQAAIFVVGGRPGLAEVAVERMRRAYSEVRFVGVCNGYRPLAELVDTVRRSNADFLLCGMGAPYQEELALGLKEAGFEGTIMTCGGFLDQLVEREDYYPDWMDRWDLRWVYRLYREPKRLWKRYTVYYGQFVIRVAFLVCERWLRSSFSSFSAFRSRRRTHRREKKGAAGTVPSSGARVDEGGLSH
jgi:N-acetylglucosaminyldiphosphoundecaprenol N-acetyl-beta-D-mannosaminyltransferase